MYDVDIDVIGLVSRPYVRLNIFKDGEIAVEHDLTPVEARKLAVEILRQAQAVAFRSLPHNGDAPCS